MNPRFNRFTINGVTVGDSFGLNQDASPTNRGPVPFDAISQVSVSIAPYDFRQSGFQGGAIDTVLLSGTNQLHGTGFYSQNTDGLTGDQIGSNRLNTAKFKSETYGATLRGPIIPDKLFFMVSGERNTDPRPFGTVIQSYANPGAVTQAVNDVLNIANTRIWARRQAASWASTRARTKRSSAVSTGTSRPASACRCPTSIRSTRWSARTTRRWRPTRRPMASARTPMR